MKYLFYVILLLFSSCMTSDEDGNGIAHHKKTSQYIWNLIGTKISNDSNYLILTNQDTYFWCNNDTLMSNANDSNIQYYQVKADTLSFWYNDKLFDSATVWDLYIRTKGTTGIQGTWKRIRNQIYPQQPTPDILRELRLQDSMYFTEEMVITNSTVELFYTRTSSRHAWELILDLEVGIRYEFKGDSLTYFINNNMDTVNILETKNHTIATSSNTQNQPYIIMEKTTSCPIGFNSEPSWYTNFFQLETFDKKNMLAKRLRPR